jgi:putative ABC transport system permease protein
VVFAAVGLVLLIACANVAGLLLVRGEQRRREMALRVALGVGTRRLVRLLLAESLVLAALGGALGVVLAWAGVRTIRALSPAELPRAADIALDGRALAFAVLVSAATAGLFSLAPAVRAARGNVHEQLKAGGRGATAGAAPPRLRGGLAVAEVALSLVLLVGAGLLVRSFVSLLRVDRGFRADHVLAVTVQAWDWYPTGPRRAAFARAAVDGIEALPGVRAAAMTSSLPLAEGIGQDGATFAVEGRALPSEADAPNAHVTVATPRYFDVLGMPLRRGRRFTPADDARAAPVVIVTEALARRHFPGVDPVGRRVTLAFMGPPREREIVGVVGDVRQTGLAADPGPALFLPHAQAPTGAMTFAVRTTGDPALMVDPVKRALWAMNGAMPIASATTLDALLAGAVRERRFHLALLGAFAAVALLLAGVGLYGVLSYGVRERRQEFGVRMALGARAGDVLALVMRDAARIAAAGAALGIGLAAAGSGVLRAMLFHVSPRDPLTFAWAVALVWGAALAAALVPARRAARVDPLVALRAE